MCDVCIAVVESGLAATGRRGLAVASVVAVSELPWLFLSLVSECILVLRFSLGFGQSRAVYCFVSAGPACVVCFLLLLAPLGLELAAHVRVAHHAFVCSSFC